MDVKNLSWEQIKELADMAIKAGNDFSLTMETDGDCTINISRNISRHDRGITPISIDNPTITWNPASSAVQGTYV